MLFADHAKVKPEDRRKSESLGRFGNVREGAMRGGVVYITQDFV